MSKQRITIDHKKFNPGGPLPRQLKSSIQKYQALFDSNMIGVASTDFGDAILHANDAFLSIIGYQQEDLKSGSLRWSTISPEKFIETDNKKMRELLKRGSILPFEKEYIHKRGHLVPVLVGAESLNNDQNLGICFALDISPIKDLERRKDDFVGMVTHELRTPLSVMKLYSDLLHASIIDGADKDELMEYTTEISSQVDRLNLIITDLFNMARLEAQSHRMPVATVNLTSTVRAVVEELDLINDRKLIFKSEPNIHVNAHKERLSQVVINLINNAIRYSDPKKNIIIKVAKRNKNALIEIQDFGIGIHKDDLDKIFERHYRVNHADAYAKHGSGIGLYLSREIIQNHGGTLKVKSKFGHGSTFSVSLPIV